MRVQSAKTPFIAGRQTSTSAKPYSPSSVEHLMTLHPDTRPPLPFPTSVQAFIAALILAAFALLSTGVVAQDSAPSDATTGDRASLERLLKTIEDPVKREALLGDIRGLLQITEGSGTPETSESGHDLTDQLTNVVNEQTGRVSHVLDQVVRAVQAIEALPEWLERQATDPQRQAFWIEIATVGIGFPILVALLARWLAALVLGRAIRQVRATDPKSVPGRIATASIVTVFQALTVAAVLTAGWLALKIVGRSPEAESIARVLIFAIAIQSAVGVVARTLLAPAAPKYRPFPIEDETAAYLYTWLMRLSFVTVMGFVLSQTSIPLGASDIGAEALQIGTAAVLSGLLIMLILQSHDQVSDLIGGPLKGPVRRRIADIWHLLAIAYVLVGFGIFVASQGGGFQFLLQATVVTLVASTAAVLLSKLASKGLTLLFDLDDDLDRKYPGLRARSTLYRPILTKAIDAVLGLIAAIVILEGWDIDLVAALDSETRAQFVQSAVIITLVILIGVLVWEVSSSAIARKLDGLNPDGTPRETSNRVKTLLPLLRRVILGALVLFCGLIVLSEIGVNIGPLLAGAGVLGLAIGFGSQALVRDIITGLFILIEDTISVGDVVTAGGHTGIVEDLSIRTIKMRDVSGAYHVVPFGDVTTVVNMTKEFSYALMDIGVAYREDTDHVSAIIREVAQDIADDPDWGWKLLEPLDMMGVNELGDSAVVIRCRVKTKPILQWGVQREFNRRIKKRFDLEGIEIPFPHTTIYFGVDKVGGAPPARVLMEAEQRAEVARATEKASFEAPTDSVSYGRPPE
jgi:small conductance mechanosensitive channel